MQNRIRYTHKEQLNYASLITTASQPSAPLRHELSQPTAASRGTSTPWISARPRGFDKINEVVMFVDCGGNSAGTIVDSAEYSVAVSPATALSGLKKV
jgi:hypothetical protein